MVLITGSSMPISIEIIAYVYLAIGFASALYIVYDICIRRHYQMMSIMNVVWPITAWYLGPLALWSYWHIGHLSTKIQREKATQETDNLSKLPASSRHIITTHNNNNGGEKPFWETIFVSATHCGAGCTLGDVISEWAVFIAGATIAGVMLFASYVFDFALAWFLGIIFQYLAIVQMRRISVQTALKEAIKADTLSLVMFEIGLFGWMALVALVLIGNLYPISPVFWFMMQIGMILGFFTSYPANWWLVKKGIKQGM